jgi:hypothetical protein
MESLGSLTLCLMYAAVWVSRLRRSHGTPGQATIMMDTNPALPGWATFSGGPPGLDGSGARGSFSVLKTIPASGSIY